MCGEPIETVELSTLTPLPVEQQLVSLWQEVESLRRELVEMRMGQRKALLEELASLEDPLAEQGVLAQRTRPRRKWNDPSER